MTEESSSSMASKGVDNDKKLYEIDRVGHLKFLLHGARHGHSEVNGLLLGVFQAGKLKITDAVPLFHTPVLAPALETAFVLVEEYCRSDQTPEGTKIVGWYHGAARANFDGVPLNVMRIVRKMNSKNKEHGAILVVIESAQLAEEKKPGFSVLVSKNSDASAPWVPAQKVEWDVDCGKVFTKLVKDGTVERVDDLDSWLEDTSSRDWRNLDLIA